MRGEDLEVLQKRAFTPNASNHRKSLSTKWESKWKSKYVNLNKKQSPKEATHKLSPSANLKLHHPKITEEEPLLYLDVNFGG